MQSKKKHTAATILETGKVNQASESLSLKKVQKSQPFKAINAAPV
jgi:hypothetical protein